MYRFKPLVSLLSNHVFEGFHFQFINNMMDKELLEQYAYQLKLPASLVCAFDGTVVPEGTYMRSHDPEGSRVQHLGMGLWGVVGVGVCGRLRGPPAGGHLRQLDGPRLAPRNGELFTGVDEHLHPADHILVYDQLEVPHELRFKVHPVDDAHLLQEGGLAGLARTQQQ